MTGIVIEGIKLLRIGSRDLLTVQCTFGDLAAAGLNLLFITPDRVQQIELPLILAIELELGHRTLLNEGSHALGDVVINPILLAQCAQVTDLLLKADQAALTLLFGKFHAQGGLPGFHRPFAQIRSLGWARTEKSQLAPQEANLLLPQALHRLQVPALQKQGAVVEGDEHLARLNQLSLLYKHPMDPPAQGGADVDHTTDRSQLAIGIDGGVHAGQGAIDHPEAGEANQTPDNRPTPNSGTSGQGGTPLAMAPGPWAGGRRWGRWRDKEIGTAPMPIPHGRRIEDRRQGSAGPGARWGLPKTGFGPAPVL